MTVLVIAEQVDGAFRKVTFEALSAARKLGGDVNAVVLGSGIESAAAELAKYGAKKILVADDAALADYTVDAYTNVLAELIGQVGPAVVLVGATTQGKELAGRLSARLDAGLATDCVDLKMEGGQVTATRPMYGGKILADVALTGTPVIVALRPNIIAAEEAPAGAPPRERSTTMATFQAGTGPPRSRLRSGRFFRSPAVCS